jgi:hypothetical protein
MQTYKELPNDTEPYEVENIAVQCVSPQWDGGRNTVNVTNTNRELSVTHNMFINESVLQSAVTHRCAHLNKGMVFVDVKHYTG